MEDASVATAHPDSDPENSRPCGDCQKLICPYCNCTQCKDGQCRGCFAAFRKAARREVPTSSDPVMDKLTEIMKTMTTMPTKKDLESFATKADINTLRSEVTKHVETKVKAEVASVVSARLSPMEARLAAAEQTAEDLRKTVASLQAGDVTHTTQNYSFDIHDPAHKRIVFLGVPADISAGERISTLEKWLVDNVKGQRVMDVGNFYTGSFKDKARKLTKTAYIEFSSTDVRNNVLAHIQEKNLKANLFGVAEIGIKKALPKIALARNGELRDAMDMLKADGRVQRLAKELKQPIEKIVERVFVGERGVTVNKVYAFEQSKNAKGSFVAEYAALALKRFE